MLAWLCEKYPDLFNSEVHTYEQLQWAVTTIWSRGYWLDADYTVPCIVPLADMLNHPTWDKTNFPWSNYYFSDGSFKIFINHDYEIGEQVWTTYGTKSSSEFLEDYGMIVINNDYDEFLFELPESFLLSVSDREAKVKFLTDHNIPTSTFKLEKSKISTPLIAVVRLYLSDQTDYEEIIKESNSNNEIEQKVYNLIIKMAEEELSRRVSIQEDLKLMDNEELSYHANLAIWFRKSQKTLLKNFVALMKSELEKLTIKNDL